MYKMRTVIIFTLAFLSVGLSSGKSQSIPTYPIPSFNVAVNGDANFRNKLTRYDTCQSTDEKRDAKIHLKSASIANTHCSATVWVYSLDLTTILGPYQMSCGETLTVVIDDREWGVLVESEDDVIVDVWIE